METHFNSLKNLLTNPSDPIIFLSTHPFSDAQDEILIEESHINLLSLCLYAIVQFVKMETYSHIPLKR